MKSTKNLFTAEAVAEHFVVPNGAIVINDSQAEAIESLQNRMIDIHAQMTGIQARGDAEGRDLTVDEESEIKNLFAAFENTEKDIERRAKLVEVNDKMATVTPRRAEPNGVENVASTETRAQASAGIVLRNSMPAQPRTTDAGKNGFRSSGEFFNSVMKASYKGASVDPRLLTNAATTYGQEGAGSDGGFAVPPDFRAVILSKVMGETSLLGRTDVLVTSSNSITMPADLTTPWQTSGGVQANWESEASTLAQSKPNLAEITIKANKLTALIPLTDELLQDSASMASYVNRKAPEKMDYKINDAIINGTGVGQPLGILTSAGTVTVAAESGQTAGTIIYDNIVNMYGALASSARSNAVWLANADVETQLMRMTTPGSNSWPAYMPPGGLSATPYGMLLGKPVIVTEAMPKLGDAGTLVLGDMKQYMSLTKTGGMRQDISIHAYFDQDITAFRFIIRIGGQPYWNTAITRTQSQASKGFFVKLGAVA